MTTDVLLFAVAGILAVISGGLVVLFAPGRFPSLLAGGALALLGLLQIGFARVALEVPWGGDALWFRYSLALALPVTALWVLASATLGSPRSAGVSPAWRNYLLLQGIAATTAIAWLVLGPERAIALDHGGMPLDTPSRIVLALILVNISTYTVRFEAVYFSLPRRYRRAFRPALAGTVLCAVFYATLAASGLLSGRADIDDLAYAAGPVALLALLLPVSFVRGRVGEARLSPSQHPITATTSFLLAAAFAAGTAILLWMTRAMGVGLIRGFWLLVIGVVILGVTAFVVSNRARRRVERAFAPLWSDWGGAYRLTSVRAASQLDSCASLDELCRLVPSNASSLADVEPITLFLSPRSGDAFRTLSSTLDDTPELSVGNRDPLAAELRLARRPIRLHGRADDLEYVSIYVENRAVIAACGARFAVPLWGEEEMIGFLLCGPRVDGRQRLREAMRLLHFASRRYAALIERHRSQNTRRTAQEPIL